ncbi:Phenylalanine--tRNA ligase beta subunit [bioreactor metagenome]|uniref:Phenylalanine--tRNA ligase beta subunit n=1 Tax=bioreactor metagenome TaxID=1076179 RepID=A0A645D8V0_9ZZZZ
MRTTALPSLLEVLGRNFSYRNKQVRLYELATVYAPDDNAPLAQESLKISLGAYGGGTDFFTFKGAAEALLAGLGVKELTFTAASSESAYHPGRCARIISGDRILGVLGQVHPLTAENFGMDCPVYAAELDFAAILKARAAEALYQPLPRFPAVSRDIAVVCDAATTVAALEACIRRSAGGLVKGVELFDVYTGAPIPEGKKSVAFSLSLRADDRTLTDREADEDVRGILSGLEAELGAVLR